MTKSVTLPANVVDLAVRRSRPHVAKDTETGDQLFHWQLLDEAAAILDAGGTLTIS